MKDHKPGVGRLVGQDSLNLFQGTVAGLSLCVEDLMTSPSKLGGYKGCIIPIL
jgi:hypothetical protein